MDVKWFENSVAFAESAAQRVAEIVARKPDATIALPTGNTPIGLYRRLGEMEESGVLAFDRARFFNLDEFVGKSSDDPQSYGAFLWKHMFGPLAIVPRQVRLLRGDAPDLAAECRSFDQDIAAAGGLDLAVLGLGANGHIAFNEPGSEWDSPTREVVLADSTRRAQQNPFAELAEVPHRGLTMGMATLRAARAILLLVSGSAKEEALEALLRGRPDRNWPVTALLDHPNLTVLAAKEVLENAA